MTRLFLASILLASCAGCSAQFGSDCTFSDGSNSCDSGPVLASELSGEFCTVSGSICLEAIQAANGSVSYTWRNGATDQPIEVGTLSGGLEFTSDTGRYYSASVDWSDNGIVVYGATLPGQSVPYRLALEYQRTF